MSTQTRNAVEHGKGGGMSASEIFYRWVRLAQHCALTGETPGAIHARRRKRIWQDGVHCRVGPDGNLYVNPEEFNKWVESQA